MIDRVYLSKKYMEKTHAQVVAACTMAAGKD